MLNPDAVANQRLTSPRADYTPPPPAYRRDGSVSTDDVRRAIQSGADSRDGIAKKLGASRSAISKPLEYLRRTGEIIEAGEQITPAKSQARQSSLKATPAAQDARKECEVSMGIAPQPECTTEQINCPPDHTHPAILAIHDLISENQRLRESVASLESRLGAVSEALTTAEKLQTKFAQLRGLLDD